MNVPTLPPRFDQVVVETGRFTLRPLVPADAEALFSIFSDPKVTRYWSNPPWTTIDQARELIARDRTGMAAGEYLRLGIVARDTGETIGMCILYAFMAQCRRAELGYALAHAHWGRGAMNEALTAFLDFGFGRLDLNRVEADVDPRNAGSVRTLERLGFRREGLLRERWIVQGEVSDTGFYGLLRSDWVSRNR